MKVKCTVCGRIVQRSKATVQKNVRKLGVTEEEYLKTYKCRICRKDKKVAGKSK